jgi:signal transduction histidine kinase
MEIGQIVSAAAKEGRKQYRRNIVIRTTPNPPRLLADLDKIRQVLQNLLSNAAKYSASKITITFKRITAPHFRSGWARSTVNLDSPGYFPAMAVSVEDSGEGIPADQLDEIFEPFHRVDNERTQAISGSGLGLTIVRYIVEAHGGKIWVESKQGKGSLFTFILPLELTQPDRDYFLSLTS